MTIIEKDPDLYLNESIPCATGVSRGYREIIDFCETNPDVYIDITSLGTFKHQSNDDYSITSGKGFLVSASEFIRLISDQMQLDARDIAIRAETIELNGSVSTTIHNPILVSSEYGTISTIDLFAVRGLSEWRSATDDSLGSITGRLSEVESAGGEIAGIKDGITAIMDRLSALEAAGESEQPSP